MLKGLFWELTTWMLWVVTACCKSFKISGWSQWHPKPSCEITGLLSETGGSNTPLTEYTTTTLPLSSISIILPAVWVDKESKGLEKHDEETLERNSSETEDFDITHLQSGMIKNFYIIFWHLRPPCSPINLHISDRILNNLEARAGCSLLRFQADMQLLGLL